MELLSPAGAWPQLIAAVRFGANAVYLGGKQFGLRAFAGNFDEEQLPKAVEYCHQRGVKVHVTLNAFLYNHDLDGAVLAAARTQAAGADAAIVADPAMIDILHEAAPRLPIHISTQANTLNWRTAAFYYRNGAKRIILARELSIQQIREMRQRLPEELELEAFAHGAVCASYSGRCVLSNYLTGRDGNQGQCAQVCRWEYALVEMKRPGEYMPIVQDDKGTTIYSANDLNMIAHLDDLRDAGVCSIKIEGRMKTDYYVATVTGAYRRALDDLQAGRPFDPALLNEVERASHRKSGTGFYYGMPDSPPGPVDHRQRATYCATVLEAAPDGMALLEQKNKFSLGEKLTLLTPSGTADFVLEAMTDEEGNALQSAPHPKQRVRMRLPAGAAPGDFVRREREDGGERRGLGDAVP